MFVQVIEGKVADPERLRQQLDRWNKELRPGAAGFLGTTGGVSDDSRGVFLARFESAAEAKANSDRPEQGQWWAATASCFDGEVTFNDSEDVELFLAGGSDDAGFVQVMKSSGVDRDKVHEMDRQFEEVAAQWRPDLIGSTRVWTGPDRCIDVAYFTSEAAAREGEQKAPPPELAGQSADFEAMMANTEFLDLHQPWLY
jgi:hypothetical protein